jgi:hypothetical protein
MAVPLFIVAATVRRFVGESNWDPQKRLETILQFPSIREMQQMEQTYLSVLMQLSTTPTDSRDTDRMKLCQRAKDAKARVRLRFITIKRVFCT